MVIQPGHQHRRGAIGDQPLRGDHGTRARELERAHQSHQPFTRTRLAHRGLAPGEHHQVGIDADALEDFPRL